MPQFILAFPMDCAVADSIVVNENVTIVADAKTAIIPGCTVSFNVVRKDHVDGLADIFKEHQVNHALHKKTTDRVVSNLEALRKDADALILSIWNQVEDFYRDKLPYERMRSCQAYGVIYYYRTGEAHLTRETDLAIQRQKDSQPTIPWHDEV